MKTLVLHNDVSEVPQLGQWVELLGEEYGLDMPQVFQLNLALEEAVVNVISYAYPDTTGDLSLAVQGASNRLTFVLSDQGVAFDPTQQEAPNITLPAEERNIGGLGIFLVKQIMKEVTYQRKDDKNILTMVYEPAKS